MKAIILSAGQGSRLGHLTHDRPKCLIEFNGRTLLDRQLDVLAAHGVDDVVVVTGFHDGEIEASLARRPGGPTVRASEVLRLAHLAGIAATVSGRRRG